MRHILVQTLGRREFIIALGGAAAWPLAGRAQQPEWVRRLGVLLGFSENDPFAHRMVAAFADALGRFGWVEGKNIRIDYRFAAGDPTLFKTYAAELVGLAPDAILASPAPMVPALREETRTIPIVFVLVIDPVGLGFVQSLARPGGNITGFTAYDAPVCKLISHQTRTESVGVVVYRMGEVLFVRPTPRRPRISAENKLMTADDFPQKQRGTP